MSRKPENIEEANLEALLGAALGGAQVAREKLMRMPAAPSYRLLKRALPAAALLLCALLAIWLLVFREAPRAGLPFAQALAESLEKMKEVETIVSTTSSTEEGEQKIRRDYFKIPRFHRMEMADGVVILDDGNQFALLEPERKRVRVFGPSQFTDFLAGKDAIDSHRLQVWRAQVGKLDHYQVSGPFPDNVDGTKCQRYETVIHTRTPEGYDTTVPPKATESLWFSADTGLLVRMESEQASHRSRVDFQYDLPLDDSLFALPDWAKAQIPKPVRLKISARDETGRPLAGAKIYTRARSGGYHELRSDEQGQAVLTLEIFARQDVEKELWFVLLGPEVIVESADGSRAALYTLQDIKLVIGQGLRTTLYEQIDEKGWKRVGEEEFSEPRADVDVSYQAEDNTVILAMNLAQKATVAGRVVDSTGKPITDTAVSIEPRYEVRPALWGTIDYGNAAARTKPTDRRSRREFYPKVKPEGTFRLELPTNYPVTLTFVREDDRHCRTSTEEMTLKPGAEVSLGDIVLPPRKPEEAK